MRNDNYNKRRKRREYTNSLRSKDINRNPVLCLKGVLTNRRFIDYSYLKYYLLGIVLCVAFGFYASHKQTIFLEYKIMQFFHYRLFDFLRPIARIITILGDPISYVFYFALALYYSIKKKDYRYVIYVCIMVVAGAFLNRAIKYLVKRPRPFEFFYINEKGYSFPSGHAMISGTFYFSILQMFRKKLSKNFKIFIFFIPIIIAFTRIVLGVHWPSDVIWGLIISAMTVRLFRGGLNEL